MKLLSFEMRWMELWFCALLPQDGETFLPGANGLPLRAFMRDYFLHTPVGSSIGIRLASLLLTFMSFFHHFRSLARLSRDERANYLARVASSRVYILRELPMLLKLTAFLAWDGREDVHRALGVIGPMGPRAQWLNEGEQS